MFTCRYEDKTEKQWVKVAENQIISLVSIIGFDFVSDQISVRYLISRCLIFPAKEKQSMSLIYCHVSTIRVDWCKKSQFLLA